MRNRRVARSREGVGASLVRWGRVGGQGTPRVSPDGLAETTRMNALAVLTEQEVPAVVRTHVFGYQIGWTVAKWWPGVILAMVGSICVNLG